MKSIHRLPLKTEDFQYVCLPVDSRILSVQVQNETICLWALIDVPPIGCGCQEEAQDFETDWVRKSIYMFGTSQPLEDSVGVDALYLSTVQLGQRVLHIFIGDDNGTSKSLFSFKEAGEDNPKELPRLIIKT